MNLIKLLLKRKIIAGLMVVFIAIFGVYSMTKIDVEMMPKVDFDMTQIIAVAGQEASIEVENRITRRIEQKLAEISGVETFTSRTTQGMSSLMVTFERGKADEAQTKLETAMNDIKTELPELQYIEVFRFSTSGGYEMYMDVSGGDMTEMTDFAEDVFKPRLEALREVREVKIDGLLQREIIISLDRAKLMEYDLNAGQIMQLLQAENQNAALGEFSDTNELNLRWNTSFTNISDLQNLSLPTQQGIIKLSEIASVQLQDIEGSLEGWKNGDKNLLFIQIGRSEQFTEVDMTQAVRDEVDKIKNEGHVQGFDLEVMVSTGDFAQESVDNVTKNVIIGGILAFITILIFLRAFRATLIVGLSIPLSILLTFSAMWLLDYSFNMLTLIALGLGIGMMVDASIVILESIYSKRQEGHTGFDAVIKGVKEVSGAVIASMLTTIVVFLPMGLMSGSEGQMMRNLSIIIVITLISSVLVSFTLIPALGEKFLKVKKKDRYKESKLLLKYESFIQWMVAKKRRQWLILVMFVTLLAGSIPLFWYQVPKGLMPDMYNRQAEIIYHLEEGVSAQERENIANEISHKLNEVPDVDSYNVLVFDSKMLYSFIQMTTGNEETDHQAAVNAQIMESLNELKDDYPISEIGDGFSMVGGESSPVSMKITGTDLQQLSITAQELKSKVQSIEGVTDASTTMSKTLIEQQIVIKGNELERAGLIPSQLKDQMQLAFTKQDIGTLIIDEHDVPVRIQYQSQIQGMNDLNQFDIQTPSGIEKLSTFITLEEKEFPVEIERIDGERVIRVSANYDDSISDLGTINQKVQQIIEEMQPNLASGYQISVDGELQTQNEMMEEMAFILLISIFLVYVVMAIQFNSLLHPLIIMAVIPMTVIGVIVGLYITQRELNIMSGMGVIMLMGIVVNNVILFISRTRQLREENAAISRGDALAQAGKNRMRPIFMTTMSTVFGMFPLALSAGNASVYQGPMATVVISGLLFSTIITLIMIPAVYMILEDLFSIPKRLWNRITGSKKKEHEEEFTTN